VKLEKFKFQLNVALLVDFPQGVIKRPLLNVGPKFKRGVRTTLPELSLASSKPKVFLRVKRQGRYSSVLKSSEGD
jgi:hypothetical protein